MHIHNVQFNTCQHCTLMRFRTDIKCFIYKAMKYVVKIVSNQLIIQKSVRCIEKYVVKEYVMDRVIYEGKTSLGLGTLKLVRCSREYVVGQVR